jgi:hypothetical protein
MACTGKPWPGGTAVSGETAAVTCPVCRETKVFQTAEREKYPLEARTWGRSRVDEIVTKIFVDRPQGLDTELADAFVAVATAVRECTRLMASIPHIWTDESEYRRLVKSVADAATAARSAYMAVDIRLRRAGDRNSMLEVLNDVLTVNSYAPLGPIGTTDGLNAILTKLYLTREDLFPPVDGRGPIGRMLDQLARVPLKEPADADPFAEPRQFVRSKLKGLERKVMEALFEASGELPLANVKTLCEWSDPIESVWNSLRLRLNKKLASLGWVLKTEGRKARLSKIEPA